MKCPHRYVLYDNEWWICSSCDDYYRETRWQRLLRWLRG